MKEEIDYKRQFFCSWLRGYLGNTVKNGALERASESLLRLHLQAIWAELEKSLPEVSK